MGSETLMHLLLVFLSSISGSLLLLQLLPHISLFSSFCHLADAFKGIWPWFAFILEDKDLQMLSSRSETYIYFRDQSDFYPKLKIKY